jgi:group I intron endonuclease
MNNIESVPLDTMRETEPKSVKESCCGIYGLRNKLNEKWYVGQSLDMHKRWLNDYKRMKCSRQPKIYNALKKYGYDGFDKVILEECPNDINFLNRREIFWIKYYNSMLNGYNLTGGGGAKGTYSPESIEKMRNAQLGKNHTEETKEKIRKITTGKKQSNETISKRKYSNKNFKHTETSKRKMSILATGRKHTEQTKKKLSEMQMGRIRSPRSEETKRRISEAKLGWNPSTETRMNMSKGQKGRIFSDEHRRKISQSVKGKIMPIEAIEKIRQWNLGRKCSEESKKKMSESRKKYLERKKGIANSTSPEPLLSK